MGKKHTTEKRSPKDDQLLRFAVKMTGFRAFVFVRLNTYFSASSGRELLLAASFTLPHAF